MFVPRINPNHLKNKRLRQCSCENMNPESGKFLEIEELMPKLKFGLLGL
jgi:hypothetical protein